MPWTEAIQGLKDELKSREVNRGRATFTLIEETVDAVRNGRPVSLSAIKGFAFAWLFPRAAIVVGSVVAALLVAAQTWILWNQTHLLENQTAAMRVEQEARLEERIARNRRLSSSVQDSHDRLSPMLSARSCKDECDRKIFDVLTEWPEVTDLSNAAESRHFFTNIQLGVRRIEEGGSNSTKLRSLIEKTEEIVRIAALQCSADIDKSMRLQLALSLLAGFAESLDHEDPSMRILTLLESARGVQRIVPSPQRLLDQRIPSEYSLRHVVEDFNAVAAEVQAGFQELSAQCRSAVKRDVQALSTIRHIPPH